MYVCMYVCIWLALHYVLCMCVHFVFFCFSAVCKDGSFYRYLFTTEQGQTNNCIRDSFDIFLDIGNDGI